MRTVLACLLACVLSACTTATSGPREEPLDEQGASTSGLERPSTRPQPTVTPRQQRLWPARGSSPFPLLPPTISLDDVAQATPLEVSPIPRAVLVTGSDPEGLFSTGTLAAMGTDGEWRLLTSALLGGTSTLDTAFDLDPGGRKLFVMDDSRREVVVVTLATARVQRFRLRPGVDLPIGWTADGERIRFTSESGVEVGWVLSIRSGRFVRSRRGGRHVAEGPSGRRVALRASAGGIDELESWGGGEPAERVPLATRLSGSVSVAPTWQRHLVVDTVEDDSGAWTPPAGPVLLLSPSTGRLTARLATPLRDAKWVQAIGEVGDRWVLLDVWSRDDVRSVVAWDHERELLRPVISGQPSGQRFSLALDLLR